MVNLSAPDFTQHPPRSTRVRLGGYSHLPRLLDKARAHHAGKLGEYHWNCPLDKRFFAFTGIDEAALLAEIKPGKSDVEMLAWIGTQTKRQPYEIAAWSAWVEQNGPGGAPGHEWWPARSRAPARPATTSGPSPTCWISTITSRSAGRPERRSSSLPDR